MKRWLQFILLLLAAVAAQARGYAPESGSFLSYDPVWNGRDPNYYTFCGGDPINYFDPDGRLGKGIVGGYVKGDFYQPENFGQWLGQFVGQVAAGFTPYWGQVADVRDTAAAGNAIRTEGFGWGTGLGMAASVAAWLPGVGDVVKGVGKGLLRWFDDVPTSILTPHQPLLLPDAAKGTTSLLPARSPWPGNSGFIEGTVERKFLMPGETFDRYGLGGGRFVSPAGTPIEARALRPGTENLPFNTYQVVKPFEVNAGGVQPWFGQPGLGTQYELPVSVNTLLNRGIIKPAP